MSDKFDFGLIRQVVSVQKSSYKSFLIEFLKKKKILKSFKIIENTLKHFFIIITDPNLFMRYQ